jgi:PAS domain S-box-containing protein
LDLRSLLARLLMVVSIAVVPVLAFQIYGEIEARSIRQQLGEDEALRLVRYVTFEQQRIVEGAEQVLNAISGAPEVQDNMPEGCQRLLANLLVQSPRYNFAAVIGLDGHPICAPVPVIRGNDLSDRAYFVLALRTRGFVVGEYAIGAGSRKPTIHMAKPFTNRDGVISGVVVLGLSIEWMGQQLERLALPRGAAAAIMDRNGTILARYPNGADFVGKPMPEAWRSSLTEDSIKVRPAIGIDGRSRIGAYSPPGADPKGLRIGIGLDRDLTFAAVTQANWIGIVLIISGMVLALGLTAVIGKRLIHRPLDRLLRTADLWRTGDLAARTGLPEDRSEFGRLAAAFDRMAAAQEAREHAITQSEQHFRAIFDQAAIGVVQAALDGTWLRVNDKMCAITGYARNELIGGTFRDITYPDDVADTTEQLKALHAKEITTYTREKRYLHRDGSIVWVNITVSQLRDTENRPECFISFIEDISERKRADAELRRLTENLEARVQAEVGAREAAQARAAHAERIQALGQLAGGIAHDFNNVLQAVGGAATLIERRPGVDPGVRRLAQLAVDATGRGASITRRLLAFGRRGDLRAEPVDVTALLGSLHEILAHTLGAAIEVLIQPGIDVPPLLADKGQLETALVNLATNARDAMPEGGRLTLAADVEIVAPGTRPHPSGLAPGRYVRLTVTDNGVGMDAITLARADEPFFTTKEVGVGTGLGLPMAKGFAQQSGGALRVESQPGEGTRVILWLPSANAGETPDALDPGGRACEVAAVAIKATSGRVVLVVDDENFVREMIAANLESAGFGVLVAANGSEALALLASGEPVDALLTDLAMPGMDGLALIRATHERYPQLPAILLTGYAGHGAALAVGRAVTGPFSLLHKPISIPDLVDRLHALLAVEPHGARWQ